MTPVKIGRGKKQDGRKPPRGRPGFTLIEMLIGLVVMSIVFIAVLTVYSKAQQYFMNESAQSDIIEQGRYPLTWIARDIKTAVAVAASSGSYTTSANTLVLQVPSLDSGGNIIDITQHFDTIVYQDQNSALLRVYIPKSGVSAVAAGSRYISDNVITISFAYYDANDALLSSGFSAAAGVRATINASLKGFQRTFSDTINSKFKLRNK